MESEDRIKEIAELARKAAQIAVVDIGNGISVLSRPDHAGGVQVESLKRLIDEWRTAPERRAGAAKLLTLESLIAFVNRHKDDGSVLFAALDGGSPSLSAVFDYHTLANEPRFCKHRAAYAFPISDEWKAWSASNAKAMSQGDWALFIEEHIAELASPHDQERTDYERLFSTTIATPADLITLSRGMQVTVESKVRDFRTLASGEMEITYEEVHKDGRGEKLIVPGLFIVSVPLFVDAEKTRLVARLRYRKKDSGIVWFYQFYRADAVVREAMRQDADKAASETGLPMFEGSPEA
jgi:uncharacterized protein YfdQ (DUF2303 family)